MHGFTVFREGKALTTHATYREALAALAGESDDEATE
jgi:hypothetical protein